MPTFIDTESEETIDTANMMSDHHVVEYVRDMSVELEKMCRRNSLNHMASCFALVQTMAEKKR